MEAGIDELMVEDWHLLEIVSLVVLDQLTIIQTVLLFRELLRHFENSVYD
jgi:hypothetical protein